MATVEALVERSSTTEERAVSRPPARPPLARFAVFGIAAGFLVLELAVSGRYGFHRDELYFLACAHHLAWGYVDQPPLVPALAWLSIHALGTSPEAIRVVPALAGAGAVVVTALMARELGGGRRAQVLGALAAATTPQVLGACHLLSTAALDQLFWSMACYATVCILRSPDAGRWWIVLGATIGIGLLNKWNIGFFAMALVVGLLVGGRSRAFTTPWPWIAAAIALALWLPNLVWNAQHQWAEIAMTRSLHQENGGLGAVLGFIPSQIVVVGPVLVVFWVSGLRWLLRAPRWHAIAITYLVLLAFFTLTGAKAYYLAGMYFVLFAAGGVWAEARLLAHRPPKGVRGWVALMLAGLVFALPLTLPVLPGSALPTSSWESNINKDLSATVGWPQLVRQVATVADRLPAQERARLVILTGDYGAAGAIDLWGQQYGLPAAISGHNSYWWWGHAGASDRSTTIAVNVPASYLRTMFSRVQPAGTVRTPDGTWTEERGDPIWVCSGQKTTWSAAWPSVRHYG
jgi:4-amino-4-deoxy-L-arabinose transferase-like glycosyltransferase